MLSGHKLREAEGRVRQWLEASGPPPGGRLPSERQLARQLGIHPSVMNRVMSRLLAEGGVERQGYKLFRSARPAEGAPSSPCDLVILQRSKRLASLRRVARELNIPLREHLAGSAEELARNLGALSASLPECVVLVPPHGGETAGWEPAARDLVQRGVPVICVGQRVADFSSVASDRGLEQIVRRLAELGHREMALLVASPWTAAVEESAARWAACCHRYASESSRDRVIVQNSSHLLREDLQAIAGQLATDWEAVTALVLSTDDDLPMQRLLDAFRRQKINVPGRLSVVSLFDHPALQTAAPPVAAALEDLDVEHEAAFMLMRRALRRSARFGRLAPPTEIDIALEWNERQSLMGRAADSVPARSGSGGAPVTEFAFAEEDPLLARQAAYPLTREVPEARFVTVDLSRHVNRPLNFRRGWLGDLPLAGLPPGGHSFHGVPFQILGGPTRRDAGAIVFQSLRNTTGSTARLPTGMRIPIHRRAEAIYVLHGCGYVKHRARFASYTLILKDGQKVNVPLIALGRPQPGAAAWQQAEAILEANIQDWWPDYPHCSFRHARMAPLPDSRSGGPVRGHVFLYTLEWINPRPDVPVTHLEVEADPEVSTTLGILAVSLLKPRARRVATSTASVLPRRDLVGGGGD